MISGVKSARLGMLRMLASPKPWLSQKHYEWAVCYPLSYCWLGPCIWNFQPGQPGSRHYSTADVNKQLVHAREKQLCGCITRFSKFLWRPFHDYDVKLPNHFTRDIKTEFSFRLIWERFLRINILDNSPIVWQIEQGLKTAIKSQE